MRSYGIKKEGIRSRALRIDKVLNVCNERLILNTLCIGYLIAIIILYHILQWEIMI